MRSESMSDKQRRSRSNIIAAIAVGMLLVIGGPTSAQFFNFGGFQQRSQPQRGSGWFGNNMFEPFQQPAPQPRFYRRQVPPLLREDFSKAPPPEKRETVPQQHILVLGDAMADWLAYGLEDVYSEQPDMGVIRKHKTVSGLIRYQPAGEPADWVAAARSILASENPDVIVVMLGLNDRTSIHEPALEKTDGKSSIDEKVDKKAEKMDARPKSDVEPARHPRTSSETTNCPAREPPIMAPEKRARSPNGIYEFRDERWVELYNNKIDEMIGVLRSKGVPVLWVGLPVVRGPKATSDILFLDALYRNAADKAGIVYRRCLGRICR